MRVIETVFKSKSTYLSPFDLTSVRPSLFYLRDVTGLILLLKTDGYQLVLVSVRIFKWKHTEYYTL